jgi:4'-phosphopantetheinyl transferase
VRSECSVLSVEERARRDRFVLERDRRDFAEAHALTRRVLSLYESVEPQDWTFAVTAEGKPYLPPDQAGTPALLFNLSHTRGLVACAVTRGADVGLDVESIDRAVNTRGISKRFFTKAEDAAIHECPDDERQARFIEFWTLKEAYIKAIGRGLACPLDEFGFSLMGASGLRFEAPAGAGSEEWSFAMFAPLPNARMAVAVRRASPAECRMIARPDDGVVETQAIRTSQSIR